MDTVKIIGAIVLVVLTVIVFLVVRADLKKREP